MRFQTRNMKRADVLVAIRTCGAREDRDGFIRLLAENRISAKAAEAAYREGRAALTPKEPS